jgi:5-hydroxyisourate hydrolase
MAGGENMSKVSTHILDMARGVPVAGMSVTLEAGKNDGEWQKVGSGHTDHDGRCAQLLPDSEPLVPGTYRLTFDTGAYQAAHGGPTLYPFVQVVFRVGEGESRFHIPLLLGPYGYTTYRGS